MTSKTEKPKCAHVMDEKTNITCKASAAVGKKLCRIHDPDTKKCKGETKDGANCRSLPLKNGIGFCRTHAPDDGTKICCGYPTNKGSPCTFSVAKKGLHCKVHGGPGRATSKKKNYEGKLVEMMKLLNEIMNTGIDTVTIDNYDLIMDRLNHEKKIINDEKEKKANAEEESDPVEVQQSGFEKFDD
uniref:Uncharacterized protein n=1 Tax=Pithovirus LCPAC403 TaxID=2506596 RepID=A0A481ZEN4_9VIRU|nr:MAG: uncharacterized protein LCPAC403_01950 [Pithovirus LCPAC403]